MAFLLTAMVGAAASALGIATIRTGREYYRRSTYKKTLIAERLGFNPKLEEHPYELATLAVASTESQAKSREILGDTDRWLHRKHRFSTVTGGYVLLMSVLLVLYAFAAAWSAAPMIRQICLGCGLVP